MCYVPENEHLFEKNGTFTKICASLGQLQFGVHLMTRCTEIMENQIAKSGSLQQVS